VSNDVEQRLEIGLAELDVPAAGDRIHALVRYLELLQQWNRAYNLTSVTEPADMVVRHLLDSATALPFLSGAAVLDAGTGPGLPGIPLAVLDPSRRFTLLDSVGKKIRFLHQVVTELRLANVTLAQSRLESFEPPAPFDLVICRALTSLAEFAALGGRLLAPGGRLVAMKGKCPDDEIARIRPPWRASEVRRVTVPGLDAERHVVVLER
jgi:16S rRNA (guanine527-N7)-methyltransferase